MCDEIVCCAIRDKELFELNYYPEEKELRLFLVTHSIKTDSDFRDCWSDSCGHYTESGPEFEYVDFDDTSYELIKTVPNVELDVLDDEALFNWAYEHNYYECEWCPGTINALDVIDDFYVDEFDFEKDGNGRLIRYGGGCYYDRKSGNWYDAQTDNLLF